MEKIPQNDNLENERSVKFEKEYEEVFGSIDIEKNDTILESDKVQKLLNNIKNDFYTKQHDDNNSKDWGLVGCTYDKSGNIITGEYNSLQEGAGGWTEGFTKDYWVYHISMGGDDSYHIEVQIPDGYEVSYSFNEKENKWKVKSIHDVDSID